MCWCVDVFSTFDGHTYERSAIAHLLSQHQRSPLTNRRLSNRQLIPNLAIRALISEFESHKSKILEKFDRFCELYRTQREKISSLKEQLKVSQAALELAHKSKFRTVLMYWCVDVLMCRCVDVLMCWCVDVLMCWCVDVLMCWCVDVLMSLMCWCVDVLMWWVLMCWCADVLMCWCVDVLMCWCVDVLMCWCVDDLCWWLVLVCWWLCWWLCWCVDDIALMCYVLMCQCVNVLMCWCVDVLMCWCVDVMIVDVLIWWVLMCGCVDVLMCWCVDVLMCWCEWWKVFIIHSSHFPPSHLNRIYTQNKSSRPDTLGNKRPENDARSIISTTLQKLLDFAHPHITPRNLSTFTGTTLIAHTCCSFPLSR